jgi:cysteine desulfurase
MSKIYLDNAATTAMDKEVIEAMLPYFTEHIGNPSSIHSHGRAMRTAIEKARKKVSELLHTSPSEIFFTSGGTESDNTALRGYISGLSIKYAITSRLEHHAVLHTLQDLQQQGKINLQFVNHDHKGNIDYSHLEKLLQSQPRSLVSLMHANNEIGNVLDLNKTGELCEKYNAVFHSDTVQTIGHYPFDLQHLKVHSIVGSAHKFHGPKGVGFVYLKAGYKLQPFITGGAQERNIRGGTENIAGIVGLAKALELAQTQLSDNEQKITELKKYTLQKLESLLGGIITYNGNSNSLSATESLSTILSISLPPSEANDMLLFNLDIEGISISGGSACTSGSNIGSHVIDALKVPENVGVIRISFSKYNTTDEIDYAVQKLYDIFVTQGK